MEVESTTRPALTEADIERMDEVTAEEGARLANVSRIPSVRIEPAVVVDVQEDGTPLYGWPDKFIPPADKPAAAKSPKATRQKATRRRDPSKTKKVTKP